MKIALIGYGKMGKAIEKIAMARGHEITVRIDKDNQEDFESPEFAASDVAIEFTTPATGVCQLFAFIQSRCSRGIWKHRLACRNA